MSSALETAITALEIIAWGGDAPPASDRLRATAEAAAWMGERPSRPVNWVVARAALHALTPPPTGEEDGGEK